MVWCESKKISIRKVATFPKWTLINGQFKEALYAIVRKGCETIGGPVIPKSELVKAITDTTLPRNEIEIKKFEWSFTNKIDYSKCTPLSQK